MILSILQYIEALWSPYGRFNTLERLRPVCDEAGMPLFAMRGHGLVDFEVMVDGVRHTLRAPLRCDGGAGERLRALARKEQGLGGRFFTEWRLLEREILLFDDDGKACEVHALVRPTPEGEPFAEFLIRALVRGDSAAVDSVFRSFEELTVWARRVGRSGIALRRLIVAPDGTVTLTGFSAGDETERIYGMLRAAVQGKAEKNHHGEKEVSGYGPDGEEKIRVVKDGGGWMYVDRFGRAVIDTVWMAAEPFRGGRAEVETSHGKGLIDINGREVLPAMYEEVVWDDYWGLAAVMLEGRWSLVDREGMALTTGFYDWLGECSEGLLLAQKGDKCGFIDTTGREVIPFVYDDASSFSEGCALVSRETENFFIDARGERI